MENKQTAVEWLFDQMEQMQYFIGNDLYNAIKEAKQMEKEQHQRSFNSGCDRRSYIHDSVYGGVEYWEEEPKDFEQYYNETYGKE